MASARSWARGSLWMPVAEDLRNVCESNFSSGSDLSLNFWMIDGVESKLGVINCTRSYVESQHYRFDLLFRWGSILTHARCADVVMGKMCPISVYIYENTYICSCHNNCRSPYTSARAAWQAVYITHGYACETGYTCSQCKHCNVSKSRSESFMNLNPTPRDSADSLMYSSVLVLTIIDFFF